jgi:D-arabinitol 4-dehydrogenase
VQFTSTVDRFEEAKIRLLNASHSVLAWGGSLAGHGFIHDAVNDPRLRRIAHLYATEGALPLLVPSPLDLPAYIATVLDRFGNAAILDTVQRVASDSFAKVPAFLAPSVRERLQRGLPAAPVAMPAALLLAFLQRWHAQALPFTYQDSSMDPALAHALCAAPDPAAALAGCEALWGDASACAAWVQAVQQAHAEVRTLFGG